MLKNVLSTVLSVYINFSKCSICIQDGANAKFRLIDTKRITEKFQINLQTWVV
jgi:hypothetical protein